MPSAFIKNFPGKASLSLLRQRVKFDSSEKYWEERYVQGLASGAGSYGLAAQLKAAFLNTWVKDNQVGSVTEFGCGDGNQLSLAEYPSYKGLDVSRTAIRLCKQRFSNDPTKSFYLYDGSCFVDNADLFESDLAISLDVIFHLVEDLVFDEHMAHLFNAGRRYVIIYSTNSLRSGFAPHIRHREFSPWISVNRPAWRLTKQSVGPRSQTSQADFFVYQKSASTRI